MSKWHRSVSGKNTLSCIGLEPVTYESLKINPPITEKNSIISNIFQKTQNKTAKVSHLTNPKTPLSLKAPILLRPKSTLLRIVCQVLSPVKSVYLTRRLLKLTRCVNNRRNGKHIKNKRDSLIN